MRNLILLALFNFCIFANSAKAQTCNTNNLASGKPVAASLVESNPASGIVDGNLSTQWYVSVSAVQWLYVDLQSAYQECRVVVKWAAWHSDPDFLIQGSSDATNWTTLYTHPSSDYGQLSSGGDYHFHDISLSSNTVAYRYVRIYLNNYQAYVGKLAELEVYDQGTTNPPVGSEWYTTGNAGIDATTNYFGSKNNAPVIIKTNDLERLRINSDGKILIKTTQAPASDADFAINGNIYAKKIKITQLNWADFVFDTSYKLPSLKELEQFLRINKHLPDIPSAKEIETDGLNVGDQQALLLRKIEELTLYIIQQQKQIDKLQEQINSHQPGKKQGNK